MAGLRLKISLISANELQIAYNMEQFEYKTVEDHYHGFNPESFLNKFGKEGWELVQIIKDKDPEPSSGLNYRYYFKRKVITNEIKVS